MTRAPGWIDFCEVRDRLTVRAVLADAGYDVSQGGRIACPIHRGDNPTAFSISRDGHWWTCWTRCGSGDALLLAQKLHDLDFRHALERCAALVGVTRRLRTAAQIAEARARREQEEVEKRIAKARYLDRWMAALYELQEAQNDVYLHGAILRHDPHLRRYRKLFDSLGDPYLREQLAEQRLNAIEAEERVQRERGYRVAA